VSLRSRARADHDATTRVELVEPGIDVERGLVGRGHGGSLFFRMATRVESQVVV